MKKNTAVAVIGGTFNPTTIAHINLGVLAVEKLLVNQVIYVPSKTDFLKEWKLMKTNEILSDSIRVSLLRESITEFGKLDAVVEECEINGEVGGKTYDTLDYIQKKYHADEIYWIMGSDKLSELNRWYRCDELMKRYHFLVIQRDGDDVESMILDDPWLSQYRNHIRICEAEQKMQHISATQVRNAVKEGSLEQIQMFVPKAVYRYLNRTVSGSSAQ